MERTRTRYSGLWASAATLSLTGDVIGTTMSAVGKTFSERPHADAEIERCSSAVADMLCAYLASLE